MASLLCRDAHTFDMIVCFQLAAYNLLVGTPCRIGRTSSRSSKVSMGCQIRMSELDSS